MHGKENRSHVNRPCDPHFHKSEHVNKPEPAPGTVDTKALDQSDDRVRDHAEEMKENARLSHEMDDKAHGEALVKSDAEMEQAKQMLEDAMRNVERVKENVRKATQARMDRAARLAQQAVRDSSATGKGNTGDQPRSDEVSTGVNPLPGASAMTVTDNAAYHDDSDAEAEEMLAKSCEELEQAQRAFEEVQAQVKRATQARAAQVKVLSHEVDKSVARQEQVEPRTGADEVEATLQRGIEKVDEGTSWLADKVRHVFDPIDTRKEYPKGEDAERVPP